jgi:hypothetical protein
MGTADPRIYDVDGKTKETALSIIIYVNLFTLKASEFGIVYILEYK